MSIQWGDFNKDIAQNVIKSAVDYKIADSAMDNHMTVPEKNMFSANPAMTTQAVNHSATAGGLPFKFVKADGTTNYKSLAIAGVAVLLLLKMVK